MSGAQLSASALVCPTPSRAAATIGPTGATATLGINPAGATATLGINPGTAASWATAIGPGTAAAPSICPGARLSRLIHQCHTPGYNGARNHRVRPPAEADEEFPAALKFLFVCCIRSLRLLLPWVYRFMLVCHGKLRRVIWMILANYP